MPAEITDSVTRWADETHAVLRSCDLLMEYFADESTHQSLKDALRVPTFWLNVLANIGSGKQGLYDDWGKHSADSARFSCGREEAGILNHLLILIAEPVPEFIYLARSDLEERKSARLVAAFGSFSGALHDRVVRPLWSAYPDLAPEAWLEISQPNPGST